MLRSYHRLSAWNRNRNHPAAGCSSFPPFGRVHHARSEGSGFAPPETQRQQGWLVKEQGPVCGRCPTETRYQKAKIDRFQCRCLSYVKCQSEKSACPKRCTRSRSIVGSWQVTPAVRDLHVRRIPHGMRSDTYQLNLSSCCHPQSPSFPQTSPWHIPARHARRSALTPRPRSAW